jgi:hypothetical protein
MGILRYFGDLLSEISQIYEKKTKLIVIYTNYIKKINVVFKKKDLPTLFEIWQI